MKSKIYSYIIISGIFLLSIYLSKMITIEKYSFLFIFPVIIYFIIFNKKPELILLISAVLITGMFALTPPDFLRIKGIVKFRDILLLAPISIIIIKETIEKEKLKPILKTITSKAIICFCLYILLVVICTVIRYSYSLNLSLRIARDYFYYIFFFSTVYSLATKKQLDWFIKCLILLSVIFAIMYNILALSGGRINLFPAYHAREGRIWGVPLARGYLSFGFAYTICIVLIALLGFIPHQKINSKSEILSSNQYQNAQNQANQMNFGSRIPLGVIIMSIGILLMAIFFTFGRGGWYLLIFSTIILFFMSHYKKLFIQRICIIVGVFLLLLLIIGKVRYAAPTVLLKGGRERFYTGIEDIKERKGTFTFRINYLKKSLAAIRENLLFGVGFLYPETLVARFFPWRAVTMIDIGYVSLISTIGIVGIIFYLIFYYIIIKRAIMIRRKTNNLVYKGIITGFIVTYINGWIGTIISAGVAEYIVITVYAMCMGITEAIYKIETENNHNKNYKITQINKKINSVKIL